MSEQENKLSDTESNSRSGLAAFWQELKRRKVMRVAITYAIVAWLIMQVAGLTFASFGIPEWAFRFVTIILVILFPVAIILAWAFELTPDGIKTTKSAREDQGDAPVSKKQQRKRNRMAFAFAAGLPTLVFGSLAVYFYATRDASSDSDTDKSIAVLPFTNMSASDEHAYFADGVHETILTDLANLRELRVISRTSVMQYRGTTKTMPDIGKELGVAYILEGSMQRAGDQFRLTAQLIDARNDEHLWAKNFDEELTNIFVVQSQLAKDVAQGLHAVLSPQEERQIDRPKSASIEAYDLYLKAQEILHNTGISTYEMLPFLERAVESDPDFTDAWLALARAKGNQYRDGYDRSPEWEAEVKQAIDNAVRLEPDNPEVIVGLGRYYYDHLDYARARSHIEPVVKKLPYHNRAVRDLAAICRREGRWADAVKYLERSHPLDPKDTQTLNGLRQTYQYHRHWKKQLRRLIRC